MDGGPLRCRPGDLGDYQQRLISFRPPWWFNRPLGCSPIECARRGWANTGPDIVGCECCGAELRVARSGDQWLVNGSPLATEGSGAAAAWAKALSLGHGPFCP